MGLYPKSLKFLPLILLATACSLKSPSSLQKLHIELPASRARAQSFGANVTKKIADFTAPTMLSDFSCYGVKVTGVGIPDDPRMGCGPNGNIGIIGGLIPTTGGSIDLQVPAGPQRMVTVFGVQSSADCSSFDSLLALPPSTRFSQLGTFYSLGSSTVDIGDDTTVTVHVAYNTQSQQLFLSCAGSGNSMVAGGPLTSFIGGVTTSSGGSGATSVKAKVMLGSPIYFSSGAAGAVGGSGGSLVRLIDGVHFE